MRVDWTKRVKGYVKIHVKGNDIESFVNELAVQHMSVWSIRRLDEHCVELYIVIADFFRLRPILKQTGSRTRVIERHGLPFLLKKLERRKLFVAGFAVFLIGLFLLSSLVWSINVEGNESLSERVILTEANKLGIAPFQWKFKLGDTEVLARELTKRLSGVAWVGVEVRGTRIHIEIVEAQLPEPKPLRSPRHLVSTSDAVITAITAEKGRAVVRINERVKRGDILISGVLGEEETTQIVVADGFVRGIVWHEFRIRIPLTVKHKVMTGESKTKRHLIIGNRALQVSGYGRLSFEQYETQQERSELRWRKKSLPFGWLVEHVREVREEQQKMDKEEAVQLGLQLAQDELITKLGKEVIIHEQKVLHESVESGKVYMKVLFVVEQNIVQERPIIQGE